MLSRQNPTTKSKEIVNLTELRIKQAGQIDKFIQALASASAGQSLDSSALAYEPENEAPQGHIDLGIVEDPQIRALYNLKRRVVDYVGDYQAAFGNDPESLTIAELESRNDHLKMVAGVASLVDALTWERIKIVYPSWFAKEGTRFLVKGWRMILIPPNMEECDCPMCELRRRLGGRAGG